MNRTLGKKQTLVQSQRIVERGESRKEQEDQLSSKTLINGVALLIACLSVSVAIAQSPISVTTVVTRSFTMLDVKPIPTDGTDSEDETDFDGKLFKHCKRNATKCAVRVLPVDKPQVTPSPADPNQIICTLNISSGVVANRSDKRFAWLLKRSQDGFRFASNGIELVAGDGLDGFQGPNRINDKKMVVELSTNPAKKNKGVNYKINVERFAGGQKIGICEPYDPVIINQD